MCVVFNAYNYSLYFGFDCFGYDVQNQKGVYIEVENILPFFRK